MEREKATLRGSSATVASQLAAIHCNFPLERRQSGPSSARIAATAAQPGQKARCRKTTQMIAIKWDAGTPRQSRQSASSGALTLGRAEGATLAGMAHIAIIQVGQFLSAAIDLHQETLQALQFVDPWTAAPLTFQVSQNGSAPWYNVFNIDGTEMEVGAAGCAQGNQVDLQGPDAKDARMWPHIRIRSGTAAAPVAQAATTQIVLVTVDED